MAKALAKKMTPAAQILFDALRDEVDNANDNNNNDNDNNDNANISEANDSEAAAQHAVSKPKKRRTTGVCARIRVCGGACMRYGV